MIGWLPVRTGLLLLGLAAARAADPAPRAAENAIPIELPPMFVEGRTYREPWRYVRVENTEYLSLCAPSVTRSFAGARERMMQIVGTLIPAEFLAPAEVPSVHVLFSQKDRQLMSEALVQEMMKGARRAPSGAPPGRGRRFDFAPNMRLNDRDTYAVFAYIDELEFDARELIIASDQIRFMLERRTPLLPAWLIEGIEGVYRDASFTVRPITLRPFTWVSRADTAALRLDSEYPRALLPAGEMFANDALRGAANAHPRRVAALRSQVALFLRWALDPAHEARGAFWKFAARAAEEPVTEPMFEECFGFGYAELRDRLSDYLPRAVAEPLHLPVGRLPPAPHPEVRPATREEVSRLRGEWERLAVAYIARHQPEFRDHYVQQARATFAQSSGRRNVDPRVWAGLGLLELDAGGEDRALEHLEAALAEGVARPRVLHEVARLRFATGVRGQPANRVFSEAELRPVLEPLRRAARQAPLLPEVFGLMAEAWVRCRTAPPPADLVLLQEGARHFLRRPEVCYRIALVLARHGHRAEARAILVAGREHVLEEAALRQFDQLRAAVE